MNDQIAQLAREAFWGKRPNLMAKVLHLAGYRMDGEWHPANGASLDLVVSVVTSLAMTGMLDIVTEAGLRELEALDK